ncbi:porin family protein [Vibrio intestinalis]|uniref:porin family protein n=1 Tax=Vibrio intestinalis TaxID=2933291 RepID=UPI0021A5BD9F|nr:porin family protein [Vibrio intestinalis]
MKHLKLSTLIGISILLFSSNSWAQIHITPWVGHTGGGDVTDQNQQNYNISPSVNYAFSIESDLQQGRIGLFYSSQSSDAENTHLDVTVHYLHFQSSVYYPMDGGINSYVGVGLGGGYVDANWVDDNLGFSASIFGGFEYPISNNLSFNTQVRWLGTVVDDQTSAACNLPTNGGNNCVVKFDTDWMNQVSVNFGLVFKF